MISIPTKVNRFKKRYSYDYYIRYDYDFIFSMIEDGSIMLLNFIGNPSGVISNCGRLCLTEYYPTYINNVEVCSYYIYNPVTNTIAIENNPSTYIYNIIKAKR